jgi:hypothetical protein
MAHTLLMVSIQERKEIGSQRIELMVEESIYTVSVNSRGGISLIM